MFKLKITTNKIKRYILTRCGIGIGCILLLFNLCDALDFCEAFSKESSDLSQVVQIQLNNSYTSNHQNIYFKDIATCWGNKICSEIYGIKVSLIYPNQELILDKSKIRSILEKEYEGIDFRIFGSEVKINGKTHDLSQDDVKKYFVDTLIKYLNKFGQYKVNVDINFIQNTQIFEDKYTVKIQEFDSLPQMSEQEILKLCLTKTRFDIDYIQNGSSFKAIVNARIKLEKQLPVSARLIAKNTLITKSDVVLRFVPINYFNLKALSNLKDIIGKKTKYTVYMNKTFSQKSILSSSLVDKNQVVTLKTGGQNSSLSMSRSVRTLTSGNKGDLIKVVPIGEKNTNRSKSIQARVVDKLTVETL